MGNEFTVIMSTFNQEQYVSQAIESVLMQRTSFPLLLLITDDHSTDRTVEIISKYKSRYPNRIQCLLNGENRGYLVNIIRAYRKMNSGYFAILDADDFYLDETFIQSAVSFLSTNRDYIGYFQNVKKISQKREDTVVKENIGPTVSTIDNFLRDEYIPFVQTTGQAYRNIIDKSGLLAYLESCVGTIKEMTFAYDYARMVCHLRYGKIMYSPKVGGGVS